MPFYNSKLTFHIRSGAGIRKPTLLASCLTVCNIFLSFKRMYLRVQNIPVVDAKPFYGILYAPQFVEIFSTFLPQFPRLPRPTYIKNSGEIHFSSFNDHTCFFGFFNHILPFWKKLFQPSALSTAVKQFTWCDSYIARWPQRRVCSTNYTTNRQIRLHNNPVASTNGHSSNNKCMYMKYNNSSTPHAGVKGTWGTRPIDITWLACQGTRKGAELNTELWSSCCITRDLSFVMDEHGLPIVGAGVDYTKVCFIHVTWVLPIEAH